MSQEGKREWQAAAKASRAQPVRRVQRRVGRTLSLHGLTAEIRSTP